MRKVVLFFILFTVTLGFSQENYKYKKFFTDLRFYTNLPEGYGGFNIGFESHGPFTIGGVDNPNIKHGFEVQLSGMLHEGGEVTASTPNYPDFFNARLSYVFGYEFPLSEQFSLFPSIKPSLAYNAAITDKEVGPEKIADGFDVDGDFDFVGLLSLEARFFFSKSGKHGVASDLFTSIEGGYGFTIGYIWRH